MELDFSFQLAFQKSWWGQKGSSTLPLPPHPAVTRPFTHLQTRGASKLFLVKWRTAAGIPAQFCELLIRVISKYITVSTHFEPAIKEPRNWIATLFLSKGETSRLKKSSYILLYCFVWINELYVSIFHTLKNITFLFLKCTCIHLFKNSCLHYHNDFFPPVFKSSGN